MALRGGASRRYAQAIFDLAKANGSLDRWLSDLKVINGVFGTERAVSALENPKLTEADQRKIVNDLIPKQLLEPLSTNLLLLLIKRDRLGLLPRIMEIYQGMYNKEQGIVVADVTTAVPLDETHKQRVAEQLSALTGGKTVELRMHQDPSILGGIIARVGDELLDASVASRLAGLAERLT